MRRLDIHSSGLGTGPIRTELARLGRFRTTVALLACLFAVTAAGQAADQEPGITVTEDGVTVTFKVGLTLEAYNAWNGSLDDPRFLFPGQSEAVPPQAQSMDTFLSKLFSGDKADEQQAESTLYTVVGIASCTIKAHRPHAGEGPTGSMITKAKAEGSCHLTATGEGPLPPKNEMMWLAFLTLQQTWTPVGWAYYFRTGHRVQWRQNPYDGFPGTQVYRADNRCVNGLYGHLAEAYVLPPRPYVYVGPNPLDADFTLGIVIGCEAQE